VSQLTLLTQLLLSTPEDSSPRVLDPPPAVFTALTASTNLCSLQLGYLGQQAGPGALFRPGTVYPHLCLINLRYGGEGVRLSEQQLQQLCSCCPVVESLVFTLCDGASPTALQPLVQLSALTR
jgi:hypothetical protein